MIRDGKLQCDRCGGDTSDAILDALRVTDVTEDGMMVNMLFCRPQGCDKKLLTPSSIAARTESGLPTPMTRTRKADSSE